MRVKCHTMFIGFFGLCPMLFVTRKSVDLDGKALGKHD